MVRFPDIPVYAGFSQPMRFEGDLYDVEYVQGDVETDNDLAALSADVNDLSHRITALEDEKAIRDLQYAYGYFIDKCLYDETVDLFADDGEVIFIGGRYKNKEGVAHLYCGRFRNNFGARGSAPGR